MTDTGPKYELLLDDTIDLGGRTAYRIRALRDIPAFVAGPERPTITAGDLGGYIQDESNLSHGGACWVGEQARVFAAAHVREHALVTDHAWVFDEARIVGSAVVKSDTVTYGQARIGGQAHVSGGHIDADGDVFDTAHVLSLNAGIVPGSTCATVFRTATGACRINIGVWAGTIEQLDDAAASGNWPWDREQDSSDVEILNFASPTDAPHGAREADGDWPEVPSPDGAARLAAIHAEHRESLEFVLDMARTRQSLWA